MTVSGVGVKRIPTYPYIPVTSAARPMPAKGTTCLYRLPPADFDIVFIRVGWSSIESEMQAHAKTIAKWLALRNTIRLAAGMALLQDERAAFVRRHGPAKSPARMNYVMGRTNRRNAKIERIEPGEMSDLLDALMTVTPQQQRA